MKRNDFADKETDELWDLLGNARQVEVSPFFSRNVLREIRLAQAQARPVFSLLRRWRLALVSATALVMVATTGVVLLQDRDGVGALAQNPNDTEIVNNLQELLAYEDSKIWLEKSVY